MGSTTSAEERNQLIGEYTDYVEALVGRMIYRMGLPSQMRDEFISAGYLGLVEAAERYDQGKGIQFKSYAFIRIRGAVLDTMRRGLDVSERAYKFLRAFEAAQDVREEQLLSQIDCHPEGDPKRRLARAIEYLSSTSLSHRLIAMKSHPDEEGEHLVQSGTPEDELHQLREGKRIRAIVEQLPEKERKILREYYFEERQFSDIAQDEVGLSKSWVSRLHARALRLLREKYLEETEDAGEISG